MSQPNFWGSTDVEDSLLFPNAAAGGHRQDFSQPIPQAFSLDIGPKIVQLRASYAEKRQHGIAPPGSPNQTRIGHYFNLLAKSSPFGDNLTGEGELAYSTLNFSLADKNRPIMARLGLKGNWQKIRYGADYRSTGSGFVSISGARTDHARDEAQLWGEYHLGAARLRGAIGESREKSLATHMLSFTRSATSSLQLSRPHWNAALVSSYSVTHHGTDLDQQIVAMTNALSLAYRPMTLLSIEPNISLREEWDQTTGLRTETPAAVLALNCTPFRDLQLSARASYARGISADRYKNAATLNTSAGLHWIIGKSRAGETSLSFQFEYNNQVQFNSPNPVLAHLSGTVQFKISGF